MGPCAFEMLFTRNVPHILEKIFFSLDYRSFQSSLKVNRTWNRMLSTEPYLTWYKRNMIEKKVNDKKLWLASDEGNSDEVERLISSGGWVDLNCAPCTRTSISGCTPLQRAARYGHQEVVRLLLERGADPNCASAWGDNALTMAAESCYIDVVKLLLNGGAKPNMEDQYGRTPLHVATQCYHYSKDVVQLLLKKGADPNKANRWGRTPLHYASEKAHKDVVKALLDGGAQPNEEDNEGLTPLHLAAKYSHIEMVQLLLQRGADHNRTNLWGKTPLHYASEEGHKEVVQLLLQKMLAALSFFERLSGVE